MKSLARDADSKAAQVDAPWRTYTSLDLDLEKDWGRTRLDWWVMLWWRDAAETQTLGIVLLLVMVGGTGVGVLRWVRYHRSSS